jgi:predicted DNA-binding transcriptional regulator YafY
MDQPKLERLLRIMKLLTSNNSHTIEEIASMLNISIRSVYRYVDSFREAGFVIKKKGPYLRLDKSSPYFKEISQLVHFTEEEAWILKSAIESIDNSNIIKQNLKKKLYTVYNYKILAETITNGKAARNVNMLVDALEEKKQVLLVNYRSSNSNDIRNRLVEAFEFTTNYEQIWCFCPDEKCNKLFRVSRIGNVEILQNRWQFQKEHSSGYTDIFRIHSEERMPLKLKLSLRAASLLTEEFPLAEKYLTPLQENNFWLLQTEVCSWEGVGRFVMGLIDEIEIINTPELQHFIKEKLLNYVNKYSVS